MKIVSIILFFSIIILYSCNEKAQEPSLADSQLKDSLVIEEQETIRFDPDKIEIEKALLYNEHTLEDTYPYKDTVRVFQWDKIRKRLALLDSIESVPASWAILQNYKNKNGEAPLVKSYKRDSYKRISDTLGVERYQSVPLFLPTDSVVAEIYGRDGSLVKLIKNDSSRLVKIATIDMVGEWLVPKKYIKPVNDTIVFKKAIFVDLTNQNIATMEKDGYKWLVRSMNPATTGLHKPPHMQETPQGIFVVQEKKSKMVYLVDGSQETGGFAPYASRFSNGGYIHGVPVNAPGTNLIEFSPSLGTTPRSHMCVRNATSHAKFIYDWAPTEQTIVFIFD